MIHCCCHIIYAWKIIFHGTLLENTSIKLSFAHVQKYLFAYSSNFFFTVGLTCAIILAPLVYLTISCSACRLADKFERESLKLQIAKFLCSSSVPFHSSMIGKKNPSHTWLESYCRRFGHWKNKKDANYFSSNILTNCIFVLEKKKNSCFAFPLPNLRQLMTKCLLGDFWNLWS